eukprot:TRINITY_DN10358_c0_g1_i3.p1 TRINITY_DN10358_c0_g1~~TRINITY_DN10358_c0_g1_i3.p1  ORF type:complete len:513 (-),score=108.28 TRINITY_DN10358_c0_g1_i3:42-1487(-)
MTTFAPMAMAMCPTVGALEAEVVRQRNELADVTSKYYEMRDWALEEVRSVIAQAHAARELASLDAARMREAEKDRDAAREELDLARKEKADVLAEIEAIEARGDLARLKEAQKENGLQLARNELAEALAKVDELEASNRAKEALRRLAEEEKAEAVRERNIARVERDLATREKEHALDEARDVQRMQAALPEDPTLQEVSEKLERKMELIEQERAYSKSLRNRLHDIFIEFQQNNAHYLGVIASEKDRYEEAATKTSEYREMMTDARQRCTANINLRVQVERERDELKKRNSDLVRERDEMATKVNKDGGRGIADEEALSQLTKRAELAERTVDELKASLERHRESADNAYAAAWQYKDQLDALEDKAKQETEAEAEAKKVKAKTERTPRANAQPQLTAWGFTGVIDKPRDNLNLKIPEPRPTQKPVNSSLDSPTAAASSWEGGGTTPVTLLDKESPISAGHVQEKVQAFTWGLAGHRFSS